MVAVDSRRGGTPLLVLHVLICVAAYALTWRKIYFELCLLPQASYGGGSTVVGMLAHPPTLALILVGVLPLFVFRKRISWDAIDDSKKMRNFIWIVALVIGLTFALSGYNYYYDRTFLFDRLVIIALLVLVRAHPGFLFPFVVTVMVFALQIHHPLPEGMWNWPDKRMPMHVLFVLVWLVYLRIVVRTDSRLPLVLALFVAGATYAHAGMSKIAIGPEAATWLLENPTSNIFVSAHLQGNWLGQLGEIEVVRLANALRAFDPVTNGYTILAELGAATFLLDRRVARFFLGACVLLHLGILATTGIFFWKWILVDIAMIAYCGSLWTWKDFGSSIAAWIPVALCLLTFLFALIHLETTGILFAWWDSRHSKYFSYEVETESGQSYPLDPRYFTPYDIMLVQSRFYYLLPEPVLPGTYGVTHRYEVFRALQDAEVEDLPGVYQQHGVRFYNPRLRDQFGRFVQRYVTASMRSDQKRLMPDWLSPPYHFQTTFPPDVYRAQSRARTIRVYFEQHFYDGRRLHEHARREVMVIPIPADDPP